MVGESTATETFVSRMYGSFEELPPNYAKLFDADVTNCFCSSLPWYLNFSANGLDPGDQLHIYGLERVSATNAPLAALPLRAKGGSRRIFQPRHLSAVSSFYTTTFGPVLPGRGADTERIVEGLVRAICADPLQWDMVDLKPLDVDAPGFDSLVRAFRSADMVVQTYFCFGNWYYPVQGRSYPEYFDSLPSAMRNTLRRKTKKLEGSGRSRVEIVTGPDGLDAALGAYQKVYGQSWKVPEPYPHFIPGLIRTCAEQGWLRLGLVYFDEEPVAAQIWIVSRGAARIFKLAHDEKYSQLSAGSILTARLMEHVMTVDKVREVDFGNGDDPYKKVWLPCRRERWGILVFNPRRLHGMLGIARHVGGRKLKREWRRVFERSPSNGGTWEPSTEAKGQENRQE